MCGNYLCWCLLCAWRQDWHSPVCTKVDSEELPGKSESTTKWTMSKESGFRVCNHLQQRWLLVHGGKVKGCGWATGVINNVSKTWHMSHHNFTQHTHMQDNIIYVAQPVYNFRSSTHTHMHACTHTHTHTRTHTRTPHTHWESCFSYCIWLKDFMCGSSIQCSWTESGCSKLFHVCNVSTQKSW